jgi:hypothetical protein
MRAGAVFKRRANAAAIELPFYISMLSVERDVAVSPASG